MSEVQNLKNEIERLRHQNDCARMECEKMRCQYQKREEELRCQMHHDKEEMMYRMKNYEHEICNKNRQIECLQREIDALKNRLYH